MSHQCIVYVPRLNSTLGHKYNDLFALQFVFDKLSKIDKIKWPP